MVIKAVMNERGEVTTSKILITVVLLSLIGYFVIMLVPMYFKYEMMQLEVKSALENAHKNDVATIRSNLKDKISDWSLDIGEDQLIIEKDEYSVRIILWWEVDKVFLGTWEKNFYFDIENAQKI